MSRTPVREATLVLDAQGLLEVRPRKGVRILSLSISDMQDIYEVLTALECRAAYRAAATHHSHEKLMGLRASIDTMEASLKTGNLCQWAQADAEFHEELLRLAGNTRIMSIVATYNNQVRRVRSMTLNIRPIPHASNEDHRKLYEAIANGDAPGAELIHRQHRQDAQDLLLGILQKMGVSSV